MTAIRGSNVYDGEIDWLATDRLRHGRRVEDVRGARPFAFSPTDVRIY